LDRDSEYAIIPLELLERLIRYATIVCQHHCPSDRDPTTCPHLFKLSRALGLGDPPCASDYGDYNPSVFKRIIRDIERKYRLTIDDFIKIMSKRGPRNLEENVDFMEASFSIRVLRELGNGEIYIARGSDIILNNAKPI